LVVFFPISLLAFHSPTRCLTRFCPWSFSLDGFGPCVSLSYTVPSIPAPGFCFCKKRFPFFFCRIFFRDFFFMFTFQPFRRSFLCATADFKPGFGSPSGFRASFFLFGGGILLHLQGRVRTPFFFLLFVIPPAVASFVLCWICVGKIGRSCALACLVRSDEDRFLDPFFVLGHGFPCLTDVLILGLGGAISFHWAPFFFHSPVFPPSTPAPRDASFPRLPVPFRLSPTTGCFGACLYGRLGAPAFASHGRLRGNTDHGFLSPFSLRFFVKLVGFPLRALSPRVVVSFLFLGFD